MLQSLWDSFVFQSLNMLWMFTVLWGVERLWTRGTKPTREQYLRAALYWSMTLPVSVIVTVAFRAIKGSTVPLTYIPLQDWLDGHWSLYILGPIGFAAVYDFFNYWMHRAQHKWFWPQHSIHHAIENLSGMNSYFHWTEYLFRVVFISAPMTFLFSLDAGPSVVAATMLTMIQGNYLHSCCRLHLGPIGRVIADNRWHRIHHSREPQHFDRNFGTSVTLWDHLFGTAYAPAKDEWPETGVPDWPEAKKVSDFLWRPFRYARGKADVGTEYPLSEA